MLFAVTITVQIMPLGKADKKPIGVDHLAFDFSPVYVPSGVTGLVVSDAQILAPKRA